MATKTTQTATDLLRQQHEQVKSMFQQMGAMTGHERAELFDCLRATLAVHETAEEMVVHPMARRAGPEGERIVEARLAEEQEAKQVLAELERIGVGGAAFDGRFTSFQGSVLAHAEAEEHELFPILEQHCDTETLQKMAQRILKAEKMAPTHPHPHGPNSAMGNMVVGPFAAMVDKVRDAMHKDD
jgi:hemerythrin superfamily protein